MRAQGPSDLSCSFTVVGVGSEQDQNAPVTAMISHVQVCVSEETLFCYRVTVSVFRMGHPFVTQNVLV